jgi:NADH-quinone oxidoreductase E subunit
MVVLKDEKSCCECGTNCDKFAETKEVIKKHKDKKGALIPILHEIQDTHGYLPEEHLKVVSQEMDIPLTEIYGVATFYSFFSLEPKGKHVIRVCLGTACYVKGSQKVLDKISELLDIEVGKTTKDGKFTLESCRCLGACGLAPVMVIDEKVYGRLVPEDVNDILMEYK